MLTGITSWLLIQIMHPFSEQNLNKKSLTKVGFPAPFAPMIATMFGARKSVFSFVGAALQLTMGFSVAENGFENSFSHVENGIGLIIKLSRNGTLFLRAIRRLFLQTLLALVKPIGELRARKAE